MYTIPILNSTYLTITRLFTLLAVSALLSMICFSVQAQMSDQQKGIRQSPVGDSSNACFENTFKDFGLPAAIRTDNGVPFASGNALFGLSKLSLWWLRLGIDIQRIKPGHPEQNGRHERMHLTLKNEATKPAAFNFLQPQERFDQFIGVYNNERPHQALGGTYPGKSIHLQHGSTDLRRILSTRTMIDLCSSLAADESASAGVKSTSVPCSLAKPLAYARSMTKFGWSASWSMIWDTSIKKGTG